LLLFQETAECKSDWVKHVERMGNARLPQQAINYKPIDRRIGGRPKQNGKTKFIFWDRNRLSSINLRRSRRRRNYSLFANKPLFSSFYIDFDTF
jgi:hypothetical protein